MKVYVVYQNGYCEGFKIMNILGVYNNIGTAKKTYLYNIEENIKSCGYNYDKECKHITLDKEGKHCMTRLFNNNVENWNDYLEIHIEEREVE